MTRRDFDHIAGVLRTAVRAAKQQQPAERIVDALVVQFSEFFAKKNANFVPEKFCAEVWKGTQHD